MNEFRADLKDYAFFFSLSVDRRKKKGRGGGGVERKKEEKRSMVKEMVNSSLLVFPYCPSPFDVCNSDKFCSIEIPTVFCLF